MKHRIQPSSLTAISLVLALGVALGGCATDRRHTSSVRGESTSVASMSMSELNQQTRKADEVYRRKPKDKGAGLNYASLLRMTGRDDQALAVMRQLVIHHPQDNDVLSAYGKALASTGNLKDALGVIERAQRPDSPDWRLLSAKGAILDQLDRSAEAREFYRKALDIVPDEPTVLSNLGMSYLLTNDLAAAETYLRKANTRPGADSRVRQNLALVVGLQGRFDEAEQIASAELPPEAAKGNVDYLRQMLTQQNAWSQLKAEDKPEPAKVQ